MQADIAAIFNWPLVELNALPLNELFDWHRRAIAVHNRMNRVDK